MVSVLAGLDTQFQLWYKQRMDNPLDNFQVDVDVIQTKDGWRAAAQVWIPNQKPLTVNGYGTGARAAVASALEKLSAVFMTWEPRHD